MATQTYYVQMTTPINHCNETKPTRGNGTQISDTYMHGGEIGIVPVMSCYVVVAFVPLATHVCLAVGWLDALSRHSHSTILWAPAQLGFDIIQVTAETALNGRLQNPAIDLFTVQHHHTYVGTRGAHVH